MRTDFYVGLLIGFIVGFAIGAVIASDAADPCAGFRSIWNAPDGHFSWGQVVKPNDPYGETSLERRMRQMEEK